jgi:hypothetical protein
MAVEINSERTAVEVSWDTMVESGPPEEKPPDQPDGFPTHPIFLPPYVDISPPTDQPRPDHELPGDQPRPDHELPGSQPGVEHPIFLPPYIDNSLPEGQPRPEHPIELPPDIEEGIPPEKLEQIKEFLLGNLPPYEGAPPYPAPTGGKEIAVQVFAQGQDGDWSNTAVQPNDGLAVLTYPKGFTGESYVEVRALDGSLVDSGTIEVG